MKHLLPLAIAGLLAAVPGVSRAQAAKTFKARLAPVPIDVAMQATVAGSGSVTAVLHGTRLTVDGTFDGLKSPATVARLHIGQRGVRGPALFDVKVSAAATATSGTISGVVQLAPLQIDALEKGSLYLQLHSERAPDGNLWGWFFAAEARR